MGVIFSQILPVVRYKSFEAFNQWWAEDCRKKINKQVLKDVKGSPCKIYSFGNNWLIPADWNMYEKTFNYNDNTHLTKAGYLCLMKNLLSKLTLLHGDFFGKVRGNESQKTNSNKQAGKTEVQVEKPQGDTKSQMVDVKKPEPQVSGGQ